MIPKLKIFGSKQEFLNDQETNFPNMVLVVENFTGEIPAETTIANLSVIFTPILVPTSKVMLFP